MRRIFSAPAALVALALTLSACGGGGGGGSTPPTATPSPSPSPSSSPNPLAFNCPTSATAFAVSTGPSTATTMSERRQVHRTAPAQAARENTTLLAVTYSTGALAASTIEGRARTLGAHPITSLTYDRLGRTQHIVAVDTASGDRVAASLRSMPGVLSVAPVQRRYAMTTNAYITNDPYFHGTGTAPLYEGASNPGQWDMHVEKLEHAFAYSQTSNGSTISGVAGALGSQSVKLAIIDTGMDVTHPDLSGAHIVRTKCFITDLAGTQNTGSFVADPDGHGTDVTGIAGADVGNGFGFAGDAGNVSLMLYRVFPTPDNSCSDTSTSDPQCGTTGVDVASAINDAVANGANVISMSFGGGNCTNGQDPDPSEGPAVQNAIAHNVILVAASGNSGTASVGAPGCDTGVIAAGASAWNDGVANGSGYTGPNSEYVASYSQYGTTNTLRSASSWGIVAPGGDGASSSDVDDLHWIENIWTSTPFDSADAGDCTTDFYGGAHDCRILIDGTSMSTPHVAGAAALVLSVNSSYQSPSAMKSLLCTTADDIGDAHQGCGRINVYRAVATAVHDPTLP